MKSLFEKRLMVAQWVAGVATGFTTLGFILAFIFKVETGLAEYLLGFGIVIGAISYIFGGFVNALKMCFKIAKWGWYVVPFPIDIISGIACLILSPLVLCCFPIIPVRKTYLEHEEKKNFKDVA